MSYKSKPEDYTLGSQPENKEKNRAPDILPGFFCYTLCYETSILTTYYFYCCFVHSVS